jgi:hypothetical protein
MSDVKSRIGMHPINDKSEGCMQITTAGIDTER